MSRDADMAEFSEEFRKDEPKKDPEEKSENNPFSVFQGYKTIKDYWTRNRQSLDDTPAPAAKSGDVPDTGPSMTDKERAAFNKKSKDSFEKIMRKRGEM
jgi:hypothetical protein